jgi:RNA-directed DNA polymerase
MQVRASRQTVTGLTVNQKVNVPQQYYKLARAMTHKFLSTGKFTRDGAEETSLQSLEGVLNHIYHIRERQIDLAIAAEKNKEGKAAFTRRRKKRRRHFPQPFVLFTTNLYFSSTSSIRRSLLLFARGRPIRFI